MGKPAAPHKGADVIAKLAQVEPKAAKRILKYLFKEAVLSEQEYRPPKYSDDIKRITVNEYFAAKFLQETEDKPDF